MEDWHATIDQWMTGERASHLLNVEIFDAVSVHGQATLADTVWGHAYDRAHWAIDFQNFLIEVVRERESPFRFLGRFKVDEKGRIDLERWSDAALHRRARPSAMTWVRSSTTVSSGAAARVLPRGMVETVIEVQRTLLASVLSQQLVDTEEACLSTRVAPDRLDKAHKERLRVALRNVDLALDLVAEGRIAS